MVYTLGESLLDIIISSIEDAVVRPGGAMLNTAVSLGRSDVEVSIITELGDDDTSGLITSFLKSNNVSTNFVRCYSNNVTSLALAFLDNNKKPKYTFIKNYPEIRKLADVPLFTSGDILLFGSLYSLDKKIRESILSIVNNARNNNATIIYDPNIRNAHYLEDKELINSFYENIKMSHIIKGSDEDFTNIFGSSDIKVHLAELRKINSNALIIITLGADGVIADVSGKIIKLPAMQTNVVSTIGAGDAFNAGVILALGNSKFLNKDIAKATSSFIESMLNSGLHFSSKVCASLDNYLPKKSPKRL
jgi:fructokinase